MKSKKTKTNFIESPFIVFGLFLGLILGIFMGLFMLLYPAKPGNEIDTIEKAISVFLFFILPILCFVFLIHRGLSTIEVNEIGIRRSLFRVFYKKQINWEDIKEMRMVYRVNWWLFVSKVEMGNLNYERLVKRKDTINCTFSKDLYLAIRKYYDGPIIGLSENDLKKLES